MPTSLPSNYVCGDRNQSRLKKTDFLFVPICLIAFLLALIASWLLGTALVGSSGDAAWDMVNEAYLLSF